MTTQTNVAWKTVNQINYIVDTVDAETGTILWSRRATLTGIHGESHDDLLLKAIASVASQNAKSTSREFHLVDWDYLTAQMAWA